MPEIGREWGGRSPSLMRQTSSSHAVVEARSCRFSSWTSLSTPRWWKKSLRHGSKIHDPTAREKLHLQHPRRKPRMLDLELHQQLLGLEDSDSAEESSRYQQRPAPTYAIPRQTKVLIIPEIGKFYTK
jgi:hypothetical protein